MVWKSGGKRIFTQGRELTEKFVALSVETSNRTTVEFLRERLGMSSTTSE
jgi:hypothetical protein